MVFGMCRRLAAQPEDAYQEVWTKVFAALPSFDPQGSASLRTWITTIARRHLIDRHRRSRVRGVAVPIDDRLADPSPNVEQLVDDARLRERLEAALQKLSPDHRTVVVQHDIYGTPLATLAEELGVPIGTIKSRLHRGRARLAAWTRRSHDP